jgi:hypothetical protein
MKRREFLTTTAGLAGVAAAWPMAPLFGQGAQRADPAKLARIAMMTLNFTTLLKTPGQSPNPDRTLDLLDLPAMYADTYGVHNIELQHYHVATTDPAYFRELRRRVDRAKSKTSQVVVEFGALNIVAPDHNFLPRLQAVDLTKAWIDRAAILDCPRIMVNQGQPTQDNRAHAIETLKMMVDYGATKGVKVTMETRGSSAAAPGATPEHTWTLLNDIAKSAGAYINIDMGGIAARSQDELHLGLKTLLPATGGSMHVRVSNAWDLATALKFIEAQGYKGLYSIEARGHEATRAIYDTILANI